MLNPWRQGHLVMVVIALLLSEPSRAGVIITGTRHIYPERQREITIELTNEDPHTPRLVQAWVERGERQAGPEASDVPFSLSPPVFRIDPGKGQAMRLVYTREPLPDDRESLFWLNVLEVPPRPLEPAAGESEQNLLRFAFRIRTKVLFRPINLQGSLQDALKQLHWTLHNTQGDPALEVYNPSAYHITFNEVALALGTQPDAPLIHSDPGMVLPRASLRLPIHHGVPKISTGAQVHYKYINDFGAFSAPQRAVLKY